MFKSFFKKKVSLADIDVRDLPYEGISNNAKVWRTPYGDAIGAYFFNVTPDCPRDLSKSEALHEFYSKQLDAVNGDVVEVTSSLIGNIPVIALIVKVPQEPSGMTYLSSVTIACKKFSFVVKSQCQEHGVTGMRETALFAKNDLEMGEDFDFDSSEFDKDFPEHPVSRARVIRDIILSNIELEESITSSEPFCSI